MGGTVRGEDRPEQPEGVSPRRVRTGPRHAAPKKSVLTRLQVPAGKAIALAAMPTAVLMGMGLTPQLASANPRPEDRYKPGPCVSQPDEADKDDAKGSKDAQGEDKDAKDAKGSKDSSGKGSKDGSKGSEESSDGQGGSRDDKAAPTPSPSRSSSAPSSGSGDAKEPEEPSASPSPSKSKNPLDPLGLGDALHDVLTPGDGDGDESAEPSASPSPSSSAGPGSSPSPSPSTSSDKPADPVKDTVDKVGKGVKDTVDGVGKTVDDAKDKADKALPKPSASASKDADGKEAFPCPEFDADAYENAEAEPTASLLPEDPWTLKSTLLTLHGLDYKGIVEVKTQGGQLKKVLKFTASGVDIKDLHQLVVGPAGTTTHVQAREGSTSTIRNGTVTMYTEELSGNLLGLIPITFSPKSPPPVNIPEVFFTDVTVKQAGQFGGDLTVPGMHLFKTGE
ncbi:hydrogenase expression protein HypF [Streptomyces sp. PRKS01-29]|nr:hydrogenase expression protein HypF [Streptomyces sabulosicollis]MBI0295220.1 hydrogenase expression protein HypF [Streptomyces sabulosicollis]